MKKIFLLSAIFSWLFLSGWSLFADAPVCTITEVESQYRGNMVMNYLPDNETQVIAIGGEAETSDRRKYYFAKNGVKDMKYDVIYDLMYQRDKKGFIFIGEKDGKQFVVENGVEWKKYDAINSIVYSRNGENYVFTTEKDGKTIVVYNGVESNAYDYVDEIEITDDGGKYAFVAQKDEKYILVQDGKEWEPFHYIWSLSYLENGSLFSRTIRSKEDGFIVMLDGKELEWFDAAHGYITSRDGSSSAYVKQKENEKYVIVKDGVEGEEYEYIRDMEFSKDGKSFYYIIKKNDKQILVKDGVEGKPYYSINGLMLSDDGENYLYTAKKDWKSLIIVNGEESDEYDAIETYTFYSSGGYNRRYIGERDEKLFLVLDGDEVDMEDLENAPSHARPREGYSFIGIKDKKYVFVRDGKEYGTYDALYKSDLAYREWEKNYLFVEGPNGKSLFLRDEKKIYEYDFIQRAFVTPDNTSYYLVVTVGSNKNTFSFDGNQTYSFIKDDKSWGEFEDINDVEYSPDFKKLTIAVKKNGKDLLITETCGESDPPEETPSTLIEESASVSGESREVRTTNETCTLNGKNVDCEEMMKWATTLVKKWLGIFGIIFGVLALLGVFSLWMLIHVLSNNISHKVIWALCIFFFFPLGAIVYYFVIKRNFVKNPFPQTGGNPGNTTMNPQTSSVTSITSAQAFFPEPNPWVIGAYTPTVPTPPVVPTPVVVQAEVLPMNPIGSPAAIESAPIGAVLPQAELIQPASEIHPPTVSQSSPIPPTPNQWPTV
jgi:Phospholipase_D-nuclease N-terminal